MTRGEAIEAVKDVCATIAYECGRDATYDPTEVLAALGCTPEEIDAPHDFWDLVGGRGESN